MWYCYLLLSTRKQTYIGATVDPPRRLRQHNKEIVGGAKYTTSRVNNDNKWSLYCYVSGFPDERSALQFEWMWKYMSRSSKASLSALDKKLNALQRLIESQKSTSISLPFCSFQNIGGYWPQVHMCQ
jgi:predicted GIY-YIG superfamily endonuclease